MAKKKEEKEAPDLLSSMMAGAKKEFAGRTWSGPDCKKLRVGIPLPSLSMMYLFDSNALALSQTMGVAGEPMTQKSSLGFELQRLIMLFVNPQTGKHGIAQHVENEAGKYSASLHESIVTPELYSHVLYTQARSVDEAQTVCTKMLVDVVQKSCVDDKGKITPQACNVPVSFTVDSLTGSETEGNREKLVEDGSLGGNFPRMAKAWTEFFRTYPTYMIGWPVLFVFINHLKEQQAKMQGLPPTKYTPGGGGQRYQSAYMIYMFRRKSEQKQTLFVDGEEIKQPHEIRLLELEMNKTSLGYDGRRITVEFIFYRKDGQQYSYFDWDASTTHMLMWMQGEKSKGVVKKDLRDIIDLDCTEKRYTSKRVKLKNVTATEMGRAIHDDAELLTELFDFLNLQRFPLFNGQMPRIEDPLPEPPRIITLAPRSSVARLPIATEQPVSPDDFVPENEPTAKGKKYMPKEDDVQD